MSVTQLAAGKTKTVTASDDPNSIILTFRDDITAGDGKKHDLLPGKGKVNAAITRNSTPSSLKTGFQTISSSK